MKVLVTGAKGFIGAAFVARLEQEAGVDVVGLTRADVDLGDVAQVSACLQAYRPEVVVHLAASTNRQETSAGQGAQWRDTFEATRHVISCSSEHAVRQLLIAGSMTELGDHDGVLLPSLPARPFGTYGLCKSLGLEVARFHARRSRLCIDWFRPFVVFGPGQTGSMLIPSAMKSAWSGESVDFTDGLQLRDFLYIDDLVAWLRARVLQHPAASSDVHVHHVGTGIGTPVRDVLLEIQGHFPKARFQLGARPRFPGEPKTQVAPLVEPENAVLSAWRPCVSWKEGIARTAAWWRERGEQ